MGKPYPIATTDVEPDCFYYYLTPDGYRLCAEVVDVPYLDALDRFGAGLDGNGRVTASGEGPQAGGRLRAAPPGVVHGPWAGWAR